MPARSPAGGRRLRGVLGDRDALGCGELGCPRPGVSGARRTRRVSDDRRLRRYEFPIVRRRPGGAHIALVETTAPPLAAAPPQVVRVRCSHCGMLSDDGVHRCAECGATI